MKTRYICLSLAMLLHLASFAQSTAEEIVTAQIDAYNTKDLDRFCSFYADDIHYYGIKDDFTPNAFIDGKEKLKVWFGNIFDKNPSMQCEVVEKIVLGNKVIVKEKFSAQGAAGTELVFVYVVADGKIKSVGRIHNSSPVVGSR